MRQPTPFGFWVAGAFSAWFAVAMVVVALSVNPWDGDWTAVWFRGAAAFLAGLAAVVTEALWRVRPWVWRASLALAVSYAVILSVVLMGEPHARIGDTIAALMVSAVVVVPFLLYIRSRALEIWPRPFTPPRILSVRRRPAQHTGSPP